MLWEWSGKADGLIYLIKERLPSRVKCDVKKMAIYTTEKGPVFNNRVSHDMKNVLIHVWSVNNVNKKPPFF